jgi:hypothetical protein
VKLLPAENPLERLARGPSADVLCVLTGRTRRQIVISLEIERRATDPEDAREQPS